MFGIMEQNLYTSIKMDGSNENGQNGDSKTESELITEGNQRGTGPRKGR